MQDNFLPSVSLYADSSVFPKPSHRSYGFLLVSFWPWKSFLPCNSGVMCRHYSYQWKFLSVKYISYLSSVSHISVSPHRSLLIGQSLIQASTNLEWIFLFVSYPEFFCGLNTLLHLSLLVRSQPIFSNVLSWSRVNIRICFRSLLP